MGAYHPQPTTSDDEFNEPHDDLLREFNTGTLSKRFSNATPEWEFNAEII
jgi:hypothetical protein